MARHRIPRHAGGAKETGAPPTELAPSQPGMPPGPPGYNEGAQNSKIEGVPPGYVNIHTPLPSAQFCTLDAYAKDRKCNNDFIPDLLTDKDTHTGLYTTCCVVMQLISILQTKAAY